MTTTTAAPKKGKQKQSAEAVRGAGPEKINPSLLPLAVDIEDLVLDEENVRLHPERSIDAIARSLKTFGQQKAIVLASDRVTVKAGNGTLAAARKLGWRRIAVVVWDGDAQSLQAYAIADNRTSDLSQFDEEGLAEALDSLRATWDQYEPELVGFTEEEEKKLTSAIAAEEEDQEDRDEDDGEDDEDEDDQVIDPPVDLYVKPGEIWKLGKHKIMCGDSLQEGSLTRLIQGAKIHAVVTDPPNAIYGSSTGIGADIADDKMVRPFFEAVLKICQAVLVPFGHAYLCCDWRSWAAIWESAKRTDMTVKNCIVWDKGGAGLGSCYAMCYELVAFLAKLPKHTVMKSTAQTGQRMVHRPNLQRFPRVSGAERMHNAAKPIGLMKEFITNSTDLGNTVLDMFAGSFTTLLACEVLDRRCIAVDVEAKYCQLGIERWEKMTGKKAERIQESPVVQDAGEDDEDQDAVDEEEN